MENQLVSIIIPAYNVEKYIEKCVNSILSSTYTNFEIILVDDRSEDNTLKICQSFHDPRITVIASEHNGVSISRNIGIEKCSGEFITFVDADDYISENMLEEMISTAETYSADMVICQYSEVYKDKIVNKDDTAIDIIVFEERTRVDQFLNMYMLKDIPEYKPYFRMGQPFGTLYRSRIIKDNNLQFPELMQYKEDVIFNLYYTYFCNSIVRINKPLYYYNMINEFSLTKYSLKKDQDKRIIRDIEERNEFYKTFLPESKNFKKGLDQYITKSFYRNLVPYLCRLYKYNNCLNQAETYKKQTLIRNSIDDVTTDNLKFTDKFIIFLINNNMLWFYILIMKVYLKVRT